MNEWKTSYEQKTNWNSVPFILMKFSYSDLEIESVESESVFCSLHAL